MPKKPKNHDLRHTLPQKSAATGIISIIIVPKKPKKHDLRHRMDDDNCILQGMLVEYKNWERQKEC